MATPSWRRVKAGKASPRALIRKESARTREALVLYSEVEQIHAGIERLDRV